MSFLSGGKVKDKEPLSKKSQFYVEFLGWMECRGLRGKCYTGPIMKELIRRRKKMEAPPKLTIEVGKKDIKITQDVEESGKRGIKKIKFPTIPARDVTYVHQATRPGDGRLEDVVACIYLGYMPRTQRSVHVHVYRFDEANTAALFTSYMADITERNLERIKEIEADLSYKGEIDDPRLSYSDGLSEPRTTDSAVGSGSSTYSDDDSPTFGSDDIDPDLQSLKDVQPFENVTDELKFRLHLGDTPLLLPPKDYDTIHRHHGNLNEINKRRCLNLNIVGENAYGRDRNGSYESGVDLTSPSSETAETDEQNSANKLQSPKPKSTEAQKSLNSSSKQQTNPVTSQNGKHSSQLQNISANVKEPKQPHHASNSQINSQTDISKSGNLSGRGNKMIDATPTSDIGGFMYPPKISSPQMSPEIHHKSRGIYLDRHNYQNPTNFERSKLTHQLSGERIQHYRDGPNDDIYALPVKGPVKQDQMYPRDDELPPDYQDDFDEPTQPLNTSQGYRQPFVIRNLSLEETSRTEMNYRSNIFRQNGADFLDMRRPVPQNLSRAPLQQGPMNASKTALHRLGSSKR